MHVKHCCKVYMPGCRGSGMRIHAQRYMGGRGVGAVLLDGGQGGQSSYQDIDDYINTTHIDPFVKPKTGRGLHSIGKKLEGLVLKPSVKKSQNINFNL